MDGRLKLVAAAAAGAMLALAAGGVAMAAQDHGLGPLGHIDANNDGKITRAEWLAAANARFAAIDRNGDGVLIVGEVPPPPAGPPPGRRHHHRDDWDNDGPDAPPPAVAPVQDQPAASSNAAAQ